MLAAFMASEFAHGDTPHPDGPVVAIELHVFEGEPGGPALGGMNVVGEPDPAADSTAVMAQIAAIINLLSDPTHEPGDHAIAGGLRALFTPDDPSELRRGRYEIGGGHRDSVDGSGPPSG